MGVKFLNLPGKTSTEKLPMSVCDTDETDPLAAASGGLQAKRNDLLPDLMIVSILISDIKKSENMVRKAGKNLVRKLKSSISKFDVRKPVILTAEFETIDGHALVEAAAQLGFKTIPCIIAADLSLLSEKPEPDI